MEYPQKKLGDIAGIKGGKRLPKGEDFLFEVTAHKYIRAQDIRNGNISTENPVYISESCFRKIKNYTVETGNVCITIVGANIGDVGSVPSRLNGANLTENAVKLVSLSKDCNIAFLKYSLLTNSAHSQMKYLAGGAAQPKLGIYKVKDIKIPFPPLLIQHKIASILSAYDDLIENNNRRIKILEEMAQAIYKEWFVNFRFLGHEKVKMVKSELGRIPEGWEVKRLGDICTIVMGQSPKSEFYNEDGNGLPFHQGVTDFGDRFPTTRIYSTVQNRIAEAGDILFSVRAPVARINIANKKMVIGRGLCAIRSRTTNQSFVFQQLKDKFQETDTMGSGTIFKSVTKEDVHGIKIIEPLCKVLTRFEEIIKPVFRKLEILYNKNDNLRKTRDLLLPKLISWEIDVEGMEIEISEEVN